MEPFCGFLEKESKCRHIFVKLNLHNWAHNSKDLSMFKTIDAALSLYKYGVRLDMYQQLGKYVFRYSSINKNNFYIGN